MPFDGKTYDSELDKNRLTSQLLLLAMLVEEWMPVVGYEGYYEVSSLGRVKSLDRIIPFDKPITGPTTRHIRERMLKAAMASSGYIGVTLAKHRTKKTGSIHRMVLEAFRGECPKGHVACHENGKRWDSRLDNLRWDTRQANEADKHAHGTKLYGSRNPNYSIPDKDVVKMRQMYAAGWIKADIARFFGISKPHATKICNGQMRAQAGVSRE
jgi:hypothetical protein